MSTLKHLPVFLSFFCNFDFIINLLVNTPCNTIKPFYGHYGNESNLVLRDITCNKRMQQRDIYDEYGNSLKPNVLIEDSHQAKNATMFCQILAGALFGRTYD